MNCDVVVRVVLYCVLYENSEKKEGDASDVV